QMFFSLTPKGKEKIQQMMQAELNMDSLFNQLKEYIQKG
ncbi:MarR family transcriptional regulator, partial [Parabacteroides distasonis]